MTVDSGYADDLKHELLTEMAENFFSRRRRLDERLENFAVLQDRVARTGLRCLARWRSFRALLLDSEAGDRFLASLGFAVNRLLAFPLPEPTEPVGLGRSLALTGAGRYRKTVLRCYRVLWQELVEYNEGSYAPDPLEPRRMRRIPGYEHLMELGGELNEEIAAVNASQCPSDMLQFTKTLDPARLEQEHACNGASGCGDGLNRDLAYVPLDLQALAAPPLSVPPSPDAVAETLSDLARQLYAASPQAAKAALDAVAKPEA